MQHQEKPAEGNPYTLFTYFRSSTSWRVRIALNYKKIVYDYKFIHLVKDEQSNAEYLKINPNGVNLFIYL
jgi:glutathione S-transferase